MADKWLAIVEGANEFLNKKATKSAIIVGDAGNNVEVL